MKIEKASADETLGMIGRVGIARVVYETCTRGHQEAPQTGGMSIIPPKRPVHSANMFLRGSNIVRRRASERRASSTCWETSHMFDIILLSRMW